jgi:hypothetical protein
MYDSILSIRGAMSITPDAGVRSSVMAVEVELFIMLFLLSVVRRSQHGAAN